MHLTNTADTKIENFSEKIFPAIGTGTMLWVPKNADEKEQLFQTYQYCLDRGYNFFDTAEIYGNGRCESLLGEFMKRDGRPVRISSKFAPPSSMNPIAPKRRAVDTKSPLAVSEALDGSLSRLGIPCLELYLMHTPPKNGNISAYMDIMAEEVRKGRIRNIGVCNFSGNQIIEAAESLKQHGLSLSAAMTGYNILRRYPETNGLFDVCKKYEITVIPYAPLAEGTLTGKYRGKRVPVNYFVTSYFGHLNITKERDDDVPFLKRLFSKPRECDTRRMEPLMIELESIAKANNKTIAQTAINWLITNPEVPVFPIPGMRNISQAKDNLEAAEWRMTAEERKRINDAELQCR